ncbi:D-2-hydroxyacid dehydrogenase [Parasphingopyxis sp. CP4]|uniref:D-2-hydroxyacid dehydrogenase n=1 Tax=Parasphingopyxis sp. CP4 TaxID=2724527 RepID=UPI0015A19614|nr:D-2-hydroxyacid dehydrogenase [Parasphingopyxis sp. CP4]QLC21318.1 D-2-hydroxyacid dehydrogenase [Parasphingopyxis sp. CP4]
MTKAAIASLIRPLVEGQLDGLDVTWFDSGDQALEIADTVEIGWFDMYDKPKMGEIISAATNLKWLNSIYAGIEHFPVDALRERGTIVTNGTGINAIPIAEYVVMGMLAASKRVDKLLDSQAKKEWLNGPPGNSELFESKVLIIGYGAIGQQVAKTLSGFNADITAVRRTPVSDGSAIGPDDWRSRLGEFDWVILAAPATDETQHMIGTAELAAMKDSAWLVNIARGSLVDQPALISALEAKTIGGAFLDTVTPEPLPSDDPLWTAPNIFITSHMSGNATTRMFERAGQRFVENLKRYRSGEPMISVADLNLGY